MTDLEKMIRQASQGVESNKAKIEAVQNYNAAQIKKARQTNEAPVPMKSMPTASTVDLSGSKNMSNHPFMYLQNQKTMLQNQLNSLHQQMDKEAKLLKNAEMKMRGNQIPPVGPQSLQHNLAQGLSSKLMPGNLGDINKIAWPFWFTSTKATCPPNTAINGNVTVTQEAAFIALSYTKAVFLEETGSPGQYQYIDPNQPDDSGKSNGLTFLLRDSQSSRQFMNRAIDINQIGFWKYPTVLPVPQLFLPNSNIEFTFQNNTNDLTYRPYISIFGLRVRIDHAKDILSTVTG